MATSTHPTRVLGHSPFPARIASDGIPSGGPFPSMSARAALIARAIGVAIVFTALAAAEPRIAVVLAFALPFWIASEIEARLLRPRLSAPFFGGGVIALPSLGSRPSYPPTDHPKAA